MRKTKKHRTRKHATRKHRAAAHRAAGHDHTRTRVKLDLKAAGREMGTNKTLYHAYLVEGVSKFYLGHVTARGVTEGRRKARTFLKRRLS